LPFPGFDIPADYLYSMPDVIIRGNIHISASVYLVIQHDLLSKYNAGTSFLKPSPFLNSKKLATDKILDRLQPAVNLGKEILITR
jgi:hypothetical protein